MRNALDRYTNREIDDLPEHMERDRHPVMLTVNLREHIDAALWVPRAGRGAQARGHVRERIGLLLPTR